MRLRDEMWYVNELRVEWVQLLKNKLAGISVHVTIEPF